MSGLIGEALTWIRVRGGQNAVPYKRREGEASFFKLANHPHFNAFSSFRILA